MERTYSQHSLSNGVDNGQVNNSPVDREEEESEQMYVREIRQTRVKNPSIKNTGGIYFDPDTNTPKGHTD